MRVTSKGQVTIPIEIRERYGFLPNVDVRFVPENERVYLELDGYGERGTTRRGERIVALLRGTATAGYTTDEILAMTRGED